MPGSGVGQSAALADAICVVAAWLPPGRFFLWPQHIRKPSAPKIDFDLDFLRCSKRRNASKAVAKANFPQTVMSALLPKADMCSALAHVCFGPIADIVSALCHPRCEMEYGTYGRANTFSIGGPSYWIRTASIGVDHEYFLHHRRHCRCTFRCRLPRSALNNSDEMCSEIAPCRRGLLSWIPSNQFCVTHVRYPT